MISVSPANVVKAHFVDLGIASEPGSQSAWPCYATYLPDGDEVRDDVIAIYDEEPEKDGRLMDDGYVILHYVTIVLVRSAEYDDGWQKISELVNALDALTMSDVSVDETWYTVNSATQRSGVNAVGVDGPKRRYLFEAKYAITIT